MRFLPVPAAAGKHITVESVLQEVVWQALAPIERETLVSAIPKLSP